MGTGMSNSSETGDGRQGRGAAAPSALLPAAGDQRRQERAFAGQQQRTDAFGSAQLVRRQRQAVRAQRAEVDGQAPGSLHRIHMQQRPGRPA